MHSINLSEAALKHKTSSVDLTNQYSIKTEERLGCLLLVFLNP